MYHAPRPILMIVMLLAIGMRFVFGAPCCMDSAIPDEPATEHHSAMVDHSHDDHGAGHAATEADQHSDHADSNSANPCCSACGPTLPANPAQVVASNAPRDLPEPDLIAALATRLPYPAYEATGPPLLI